MKEKMKQLVIGIATGIVLYAVCRDLAGMLVSLGVLGAGYYYLRNQKVIRK